MRPRLFSQTVSRSRLPLGDRVYAIGDIHGEITLLARALTAIRDDSRARGPARVTLVLLGDAIDRGPAGADLLRGLAGETWPGLVILRGNHEAAMASAFRGDEPALRFWLAYGGVPTLAGLGIAPAVIESDDPAAIIGAMRHRIDAGLIAWMERLPTSWSIGDYFFAHAGIRPGVPLAEQQDEDLLWIRDDFLEHRRRHAKIVVHGHTVAPGKVRLGGNRIGLDTGAHEHGVLSVLGLEDDDRWLIQSRRDIAVDARGRLIAAQPIAAAPPGYGDVSRLIAAVLTDHRHVMAAKPARSEDAAASIPYPSRRARGGREAAIAAAVLTIAGVAAGLALRPIPERPATAPIRLVGMAKPVAPRLPDSLVAPSAAEVAVQESVRTRATPRRPQAGHGDGASAWSRLAARAPPPARRAQAFDPYAGRVVRHLTGQAQALAIAADREATREMNVRQLRASANPAVSLGDASRGLSDRGPSGS